MLEQTRQLREFRKIIGNNINKYRLERSFTLSKLANMVNINPELIDRWEVGKHEVSIQGLATIAVALNINILDLIGGPSS